MVSTHLKNISQIGNLPQVGGKIKNIWNHHQAWICCLRWLAQKQQQEKSVDFTITPKLISFFLLGIGDFVFKKRLCQRFRERSPSLKLTLSPKNWAIPKRKYINHLQTNECSKANCQGFEGGYLEDHPRTCKWLVTPIYKPFRPFGRGIALLRDLLTMVINHVLTGMILQVLGTSFKHKKNEISHPGENWVDESHPDLLLRCLEKGSKHIPPKWWWKMVIYHGKKITNQTNPSLFGCPNREDSANFSCVVTLVFPNVQWSSFSCWKAVRSSCWIFSKYCPPGNPVALGSFLLNWSKLPCQIW